MTKISIWIHGPEFGSSMIQVPIIQELWKSNSNLCLDFNVVAKNRPIFEYYFSDKINTGLSTIENIRLIHELKYNHAMNLNVYMTVLAVGKNIITYSIPFYNQFKRRVYDNDVDLLVSGGLAEIGIMPKLVHKPRPKTLYLFNYLLEHCHFFKQRRMNELAKMAFVKHYKNFDKTVIQTFFPDRPHEIAGLKNVELINAIARKPTKTRKEVRQELEIKNNEKLIFLALGGAKFFEKLVAVASEISKIDSSIRFLLLPRTDTEIKTFKKMKGFVMPKSLSFDTQNYIGASDMVITKCGFSTITEAIDNRINIISLHLPNHAEVTETEIILKNEGIIKNSVDLAKENSNSIYRIISGELDNKESRDLMGKMRMDGAEQAAKIYREMT